MIASLFQEGSFFISGCIQIKFLISTETLPHPISAAFTVPKSKFKLAVDRNLIKRRMKNVYRLNKHHWYQDLEAANKQILVIFIYGAKKTASSTDIEKDLLKGMNTLLKKLS